MLVGHLANLGRQATAGLVKSAEARAISHLARSLLNGIDEQLAAFKRPIAETEQRLRLRRSTAELEQALGDLRYLLAAEQDHVRWSLIQERSRFLQHDLGEALIELHAAVQAMGKTAAAQIRERSMEAAQQIAHRRLDRWLEVLQPVTERHHREAAQRFVDLANGFLAGFEAARDLGLDQIPPSLAAESELRVGGQLFYTELLHLAGSSWLSWLLDQVTPRSRAAPESRTT